MSKCSNLMNAFITLQQRWSKIKSSPGYWKIQETLDQSSESPSAEVGRSYSEWSTSHSTKVLPTTPVQWTRYWWMKSYMCIIGFFCIIVIDRATIKNMGTCAKKTQHISFKSSQNLDNFQQYVQQTQIISTKLTWIWWSTSQY